MSGTAAVDKSARSQAIKDGFRINFMNICNADTGEMVWHSGDIDWENMLEGEEIEIRLPRRVLGFRAVSREMNFSSVEQIDKFRLIQWVRVHGQDLEQWGFHFGFVIPNSTNSWQNIIEAADNQDMLPADVLSGNLTIETQLYNDLTLVATSKLRVFYVDDDEAEAGDAELGDDDDDDAADEI